jgi:hypothetical protein
MMTLISLAITVAFVFSLAVTCGFPGSDLWWELATLVTNERSPACLSPRKSPRRPWDFWRYSR